MSEPYPRAQRHVDYDAPVRRFAAGDRVTWNYSEAQPRAGVVVTVAEFDSIYCSGEGEGFTPWGNYLGRLTLITCERADCFCKRPSLVDGVSPLYHHCNECQLSPDVRTDAPLTLF